MRGNIMKYIDIYVFGEAGPFDEYNPYRIFENLAAQQVILEIAKRDVLTVDKDYLQTKLDLSKSILDEVLSTLLKAQLVFEENGFYTLRFPLFVEEDIVHIKEFSNGVSCIIGDIIYNHKTEYDNITKKYPVTQEFGIERVLYHTIGDKVFDGSALDYFSEKNLFAISKIQPLGRDYQFNTFVD